MEKLRTAAVFLVVAGVLLGVSALCQSCGGQADRIDVIFDTDANNEVDDQHAIAYLLLSEDTFRVLALTTNTTKNGGDIASQSLEARRVEKLVGREDVPVIDGADGSFEQILPHIGEETYDGCRAVDLIVREARRHSARKPLTLIAVGKLTNVALALAEDPSIAPRIRLVWLGTQYPDPGEYNFENDIAAANYVLDSPVPMEVAPTFSAGQNIGTAAVRVSTEYACTRFAGLGPQVPEPVEGRHGGAFTCFGDYSVDLFRHLGKEAKSLYDLTAVAIVKNPAWGKPRTMPAPAFRDGRWIPRPDNPRTILFWEHFDKDAIIADFEQTLSSSRQRPAQIPSQNQSSNTPMCTVSQASDCLKAWQSLPLHSDTDTIQLKEQIAAAPALWQEVYDFLRGNDLATLSLGRHEIGTGGAYANVQEYQSKTEGVFEAHRDYIDVQIVVSGQETIDVAALQDACDCTMEYDKGRDCVLYASASKIRSFDADPSAWFVFFPSDLHRPGMARGGVPSPVKKIVVKIPVAR